MAEKEILALRLLIGLQERANVLRLMSSMSLKNGFRTCCLILCCSLPKGLVSAN